MEDDEFADATRFLSHAKSVGHERFVATEYDRSALLVNEDLLDSDHAIIPKSPRSLRQIKGERCSNGLTDVFSCLTLNQQTDAVIQRASGSIGRTTY